MPAVNDGRDVFIARPLHLIPLTWLLFNVLPGAVHHLQSWGLEASERDGKLVSTVGAKQGSALGMELGSGLEASEMDGKLGLAMGIELGAGLEAAGMDGKLVSAMGTKLGAGLEASGWVLDGMSSAGKRG